MAWLYVLFFSVRQFSIHIHIDVKVQTCTTFVKTASSIYYNNSN